uniref:ATP synthase F0 subunit 8 n=1 Tax=Euphaedusa planostriata TaxID=2798995 RepID=A0A7T7D6M2_9EUPU|nr:ATP synthase F0 subunit 8 [Euphaedusa planostriata]QQL04604.1 ATP synthase F0 subunit 8 [Euphaedusa planostriata]
MPQLSPASGLLIYLFVTLNLLLSIIVIHYYYYPDTKATPTVPGKNVNTIIYK